MKLSVVSKGRWRLDEDLNWHGIRVPRGFETDGASVPQWLRWLLPRWGSYGEAAVVHDYLWQSGMDRQEADTWFWKIMADEVHWFTRIVMYVGVRLAGQGFNQRIDDSPRGES